jgi:hypothetical protein
MARASATAENNALAGIFAASAPTASATSNWGSLHVGDPGTTGASENANSGSYARIQYSAGTPASGAISNTGAMTFTTGGTVAVTHVGTWTSATYGAGTYNVGAALTSPVTAVTITFAVGAISFSVT